MQKTKIGHWFQPKKALSCIFAALLIFNLSGCNKDSAVTDTGGNIKLKKTSFNELTGWNDENFTETINVFAKNCEQLNKNKNTYTSAEHLKIKVSDLQNKCAEFTKQNINSSQKMKNFIEAEFIPYAVTDNGKAEGKFTSYYEAVINASYTKDNKYKYPVYGKPNDLIEINLRDFDKDLPDTRLVGRVVNNKFVPYYNRRDIENNGISAPVFTTGFFALEFSSKNVFASGTKGRTSRAM